LQPDILLTGEFHGFELQEAYESLLRRENDPVTFALVWGDE
jgi:hypothetical protein